MRVTGEFYFISTAARLLGMHPQTLRKYERLGLVRPTRTVGSMRVYTGEQLERLRLIKHLVDELGINLAGVRQLLSVAESVERLRQLTGGGALGRRLAQRHLAREIDRLCEILGLDRAGDDNG
jgi:MerR family transcriptional regulator/heat shock protein HspR